MISEFILIAASAILSDPESCVFRDLKVLPPADLMSSSISLLPLTTKTSSKRPVSNAALYVFKIMLYIFQDCLYHMVQKI